MEMAVLLEAGDRAEEGTMAVLLTGEYDERVGTNWLDVPFLYDGLDIRCPWDEVDDALAHLRRMSPWPEWSVCFQWGIHSRRVDHIFSRSVFGAVHETRRVCRWPDGVAFKISRGNTTYYPLFGYPKSCARVLSASDEGDD